jgi:protein-L-isoaspartate(D-aspartate) O-methyltransferase
LSQTISQPWIVARMTEALLDNGNPKKVLEVGTGSGYQAAVLSHLVPKVFTVERIDELLKLARRRFHRLRLHNIYVRYADGHLGWPSQAPFDGIMVTAAAQSVPRELLEQLAVGGLLVLPLEKNGQQRLISIRRTEDDFEELDLGGVVFVPLLSGLA